VGVGGNDHRNDKREAMKMVDDSVQLQKTQSYVERKTKQNEKPPH